MSSRGICRRLVAVVFAGRLALAPFAFAEDPTPETAPLRAAAAREASRLSQPARRGPMPGGLKWTGLGLLMGSGLPVLIAKFGDCVPSDFSCRDQRHAAYAVAGVLAGTGAALLVIAHAKRSPALPTIVVRDGRVVLQQRIAF
jgi:hypothetical protein